MEAEPQNNCVQETDYVLLIDNRGNRIISNIKKDRYHKTFHSFDYFQNRKHQKKENKA